MNRISARSTFVTKKVLPVFFIGFLVLFISTNFRFATRGGDVMFLVIPFIMLVVGAVAFRSVVWPLLDEVDDAGSYLIARRGSDEERIELRDIMNVSVSSFSNPPRITLRLARSSTKFGNEVSFLPRTGFRLTPFSRIKLADELIERVHHERSRRAV